MNFDSGSNPSIGGSQVSNANPMPVVLESQDTAPIDLYFIQATGTPTTLSAATSVDDNTITLASVTAGFVDGAYVGIFCPTEGRFYFANQIGAAVGNVITLDTPLDFAFDIGDNVLSFTRDLNVDGSSTPSVFEIQGPGGGANVEITRIIISMIHDSAGDDGKFGGGSPLAKGIVLRRANGTTENIWNVKTNSDLATIAYDVSYSTRTVPAGSYGTRVRYTFGGQDKHDTAIKLASGDSLKIIIQDDLTEVTQGLISLRIIAAGRVSTT